MQSSEVRRQTLPALLPGRAGLQADRPVLARRAEGYRVVLVNSNPVAALASYLLSTACRQPTPHSICRLLQIAALQPLHTSTCTGYCPSQGRG